MNLTKINFKEVNVPLNSKYIEELGKQYAKSFDDEPMFIIKTKNKQSIMVEDKSQLFGYREDEEEIIKINVLKVFKISNGWMGIIDGHFSTDYTDYTITHISKLEL